MKKKAAEPYDSAAFVVRSRNARSYFCPPEQLPDTSRIELTRSEAILPCELAPEDMLPVEPAVEPGALVEPAVEPDSPAFSIVPFTSTFLPAYLSRSSLGDAISLRPSVVALEGSGVVEPAVPAVLPVVELLPCITFLSTKSDELVAEPAVAPGCVDPVVPVAPPVPRSTHPVTVTALSELLWLLGYWLGELCCAPTPTAIAAAITVLKRI